MTVPFAPSAQRWITQRIQQRLIHEPGQRMVNIEVVLASDFDSLRFAYDELTQDHRRMLGNNEVLRANVNFYRAAMSRIMSKHKIDPAELQAPEGTES